MARCHITGTEFPVDQGYVLDKNAVHRTLKTLKKQVNGLEQLMRELGQNDENVVQDGNFTGRRLLKRMVCKAIADAISQVYPGIDVFVSWPEYKNRRSRFILAAFSNDPVYGPAIRTLNEPELSAVASLNRQVLALLDPRKQLPESIRHLVCVAVCVTLRSHTPAAVISRIRSTLIGSDDLATLGISSSEHESFSRILRRHLGMEPAVASGQDDAHPV